MTIPHYLPTIVVRHRRENLKKCSLRGLEDREDFMFFRYPGKAPEVDPAAYVLLAFDGEPLSPADCSLGLFVVDATWRLAEKICQNTPVVSQLVRRSLPTWVKTAYPRRQPDCTDPERGLASAEAIFTAYHLMGRQTDGILDHYHWREPFLEQFENTQC